MKTSLYDILSLLRCSDLDSEITVERSCGSKKVEVKFLLPDGEFEYFFERLIKRSDDETNQG